MSATAVVDYRRALEALRSGVPNRDAVKVLGCHQPAVEERFRKQLAALDGSAHVAGLLMAGGFGSGKSHVLEYLEHLATSEKCVCSRIVVSKETPLYDPAKVYRAAIENASVPGVNGRAIQEIAHVLRPGSARYAEFYRWVNSPDSGLAAIFPATLYLHERLNNDPELVEDITNFWAGDTISVARIKQGLKQVGGVGLFSVKGVSVSELAMQRFAFASGLIRAAGFEGWALLIDEAELIGRYSPLQRGRSYAELARWMGIRGDAGVKGLTAVIAITDDFGLAVLEEKGDRDKIGSKLAGMRKGDGAGLAAAAERGMQLIENQAVLLAPPDDALLDSTYARLKQIHSSAYNWAAPDASSASRTLKRPMRSYVRRWINEWDLARAYPGERIQIQEDAIETTYTEDADLEVSETEPSEASST